MSYEIQIKDTFRRLVAEGFSEDVASSLTVAIVSTNGTERPTNNQTIKHRIAEFHGLSDNEWIFIKEAAKRIGYAEQTVYRWVKENKLAHRRVADRIEINVAILKRFVESFSKPI